MYYSYVEIEYVATSFSPTRMDLALKLLKIGAFPDKFLFGQGVPNGLPTQQNWKHYPLYYDG